MANKEDEATALEDLRQAIKLAVEGGDVSAKAEALSVAEIAEAARKLCAVLWPASAE